ncbi:hypothetical protein BOX15_Mlig001759g1 [Macrostomum lignano]|uniref:Thyroglobulin type-1 domain-containing protein n=2 Tax=Macrostomum lignano TaxID=282301 RepID=A0A267EU77_9PLAT|nr:hypothetical protein BOX15_Mlig001759g1 [Macrostomum lignano]
MKALQISLLLVAIQIQLTGYGLSQANAQTTLSSVKGSGSGSGAWPLDDEDLGRGRASGDGQPSGASVPPSSSPVGPSSSPASPAVGTGVAVTRIALPTLPTDLVQPGFDSTSRSATTAVTVTSSTRTDYLPCRFFAVYSLNSPPFHPKAPAWLGWNKDSSKTAVQRPSCNPQRPELYNVGQCLSHSSSNSNNRICFCVNAESGRLVSGTETQPAVFVNLSCQPLSFRLILGFRDQWQPALADPSGPEFESLAERMEREIDAIFYQYAGNQTAKVLAFRRGSILAELLVTSVGHPKQLVGDAQSFKSLLDRRVQSTTGKLAGMTLNPLLYELQPVEAEGGRNPGNHGSRGGQLPSDAKNLKQGMSDTTPSAESSVSGSGGFAPTPAILGAIVGGGIGALALIILLIVFCVYRIRKADEGSYSLDPAKKAAANTIAYEKAPSREFYA